MIEECPCRYCENRTPECHGKCKRYRIWFRKSENLRRHIYRKLSAERMAVEDATIRSIKHGKRRGKIK